MMSIKCSIDLDRLTPETLKMLAKMKTKVEAEGKKGKDDADSSKDEASPGTSGQKSQEEGGQKSQAKGNQEEEGQKDKDDAGSSKDEASPGTPGQKSQVEGGQEKSQKEEQGRVDVVQGRLSKKTRVFGVKTRSMTAQKTLAAEQDPCSSCDGCTAEEKKAGIQRCQSIDF